MQRRDGIGIDHDVDIRSRSCGRPQRRIDDVALDVQQARADAVGDDLHSGAREVESRSPWDSRYRARFGCTRRGVDHAVSLDDQLVRAPATRMARKAARGRAVWNGIVTTGLSSLSAMRPPSVAPITSRYR